jgi:hypothetical protein
MLCAVTTMDINLIKGLGEELNLTGRIIGAIIASTANTSVILFWVDRSMLKQESYLLGVV